MNCQRVFFKVRRCLRLRPFWKVERVRKKKHAVNSDRPIQSEPTYCQPKQFGRMGIFLESDTRSESPLDRSNVARKV